MKPSDPPGQLRKPYFEAWLRRTRRELSASGRLSEISLILSAGKAGEAAEWRELLRKILGGEEEPGLELLTEIDTLLARPARPASARGGEADLFD